MINQSKNSFFLGLVIFIISSPAAFSQYTRGTIGFSNTLNFSTEWYQVTGIEQRSVPFAWSLSGSPTIDFLGQSMPFSFLFSNYQNSYSQPFNYFGLSPSFKWAKFHLGYRNINFSPFTLGGHRILGAGVELNPGKWDVGFAYGRLQKAIEIDSSFRGVIPGLYQQRPSFNRWGYAAKIGYGDPDSAYFAFTYLHAWDQENSLNFGELTTGIRPASNDVLGFSSRMRMFSQIFWKTEIAISAYTRDTQSDTIDLEDNQLLKTLNQVFPIKSSSQGFYALESSLAWQSTQFGLSLTYRRITPDFKSMGTYYLQTDLEQFTVSPSLRFPRARFQGSVGWQHDNLQKLKSRTSERFIGNALFDWQMSDAFGISLQYANFGFTQSPLTRSLVDTTLLEQVNQSFALTPRMSLRGQNAMHNFVLSLNYNELADRRTQVFAPTELSSLQTSLVYNLALIASQVSLNLNGFFANNKTFLLNSTTIGGGLGIQSPLFGQRMNLSTNGNFFKNKFENESQGRTVQANFQLAVPLAKQHTLTLSGQWMRNRTEEQSLTPDFTEWRFRSGYSFSFSSKSKKSNP